MTESSPVASAPTLLAMVMCEQLIRDPETGRFYLMGTQTQTFARGYPARLPRMCMYAVLTGIRGTTELELRLVRPDSVEGDDVEVMTARGRVSANDPLVDAELALMLRNLVLPQPGEYRFQLWAGTELLGERKFMVRETPGNPPSPDA